MQTIDRLAAPIPTTHRKHRLAASIVLVALSDFLFFRHGFGLNLFLFAVSVTAAILLCSAKPPRPVEAGLWLGVSIVASAPLLLASTWTGMGLSLGAVMCIALSQHKLLPRRLSRIPFALISFCGDAPTRFAKDARSYLAKRSNPSPIAFIRRNWGGWAVPITAGLIFVALFTMANPLIEDAFRQLDIRLLLRLTDPWRLCLWFAVAVFTWAMLRPHLARKAIRPKLGAVVSEDFGETYLGRGALVRSLIVFNLLFFMQTLMDLFYLWGGADLPDGMTHARYAHRGAYALVVTALLAVAFVLVAMRRGGAGEQSGLIRALVYAWVGQNILLCLSSILRLDLYVETYSLTELRVAAAIWMGLVAVGLALVLLRIRLRRSNEWLVGMNLAALLVALYLSAVIDIPAFIARFNVTHSQEFSQQGSPLDLDYLNSLGPSVIPALDLFLAAPYRSNSPMGIDQVRMTLANTFILRSKDWRSWTFRDAQLDVYLLPKQPVAN